jgi:hypothetical protein
VSQEKAELLRRLEAFGGITIPDGARILGPRDGWRWRLTDSRGHDPADGPLGSPHSIADMLASEWVVTAKGATRTLLPG